VGGGRQRLVLGLVAAVLAVATAVVLVNRFVLQAEWWQVDHDVTAAPAPRLAELGPPPGPIASTWQLATAIRHTGLSPYDQVAHAVVLGQIVVASGRGLDVRDARTGRARWHYYRSDWALLGWATTRDHIVAYLERAGHRDDRRVVGFDAVSGRQLWRVDGDVPAGTERTTLRWPAGSDVVLTTDGDRGSLRGRSAATGEQVWTASLPHGCALPEAAALGSGGSETLAVLALDCEGKGRLLAFDPGTGRARWAKTFRTVEPPVVAVTGEVTTVFDGTALRVYSGTGKEIATRSGDDLCRAMCPVARFGDRLVVVYREEGRPAGRRMEAIDVPSGRSAWSREAPDYAALTVTGDQIYALRPRLTEDLLPAGIDIVAPADGATTTVPAPFVLGPGVEGVRPWLAAAGGLLYVAVPEAEPRAGADERDDPYPAGAARLIALRGGPAGRGPEELGGVAEVAWPDACGLLRESDLAAVRPGGYTARPDRASIGDVRLPHPVSCTYEPKTGERTGESSDAGSSGDDRDHGTGDVRKTAEPEPSESQTPEPAATAGANGPDDGTAQSAAAITVTVEWVADDAATARELLTAWRATLPRVRPLLGIHEEAYELGTSGTIAVRVDRYIVAVNAYQSPGVATRLARAAAARLAS
jgi:putative pyrroloquinoline-quinone binding quinoprotein